MAKKNDPLKPSAELLSTLGSIIVHADEMISGKGHHFDEIELRTQLSRPIVTDWLQKMDKLALIPKKR